MLWLPPGVKTVAGVANPTPTADYIWDPQNYADQTALYADVGSAKTFEGDSVFTNTYANVALGTDGGYGGRTKYFRNNYLNATGEGGSGTSGRCTNAGHSTVPIMSGPFDVGTIKRVWAEVQVRFSSNFKMGAGAANQDPSGWACTSAPEFKVIFGYAGSTSRFNIEATDGQWEIGYPTNENASGAISSPAPSSFCDGAFHTWRTAMAVSSDGSVAVDGFVAFAIDGSTIYNSNYVAVPRGPMQYYAVSVTRNQGAPADMSMDVGLVSFWYGTNNPGWFTFT